MTAKRIDDLCAKGILGVILLVLAIGPLAMGATRNEELSIIAGLVMFGVVLWMVRVWLSPKYELAWPPMCFAVLAFVVYALFRYPEAPVEYSARSELYRTLIYSFLFFLVLNNFSYRYINWIAYLVMGLGVFMSLYALYQFMTRSDMVWNLVRPAQYAGRGSGTYICPNHLAGFLECAIPLGLGYLLLSRINYTKKMILGYATLMMLAGLAATVSRGGWIAMAAGLLLQLSVLIFRKGRRLPAIILFVIVIIGGLWFVSKSELTRQRIDQMVLEDGRLDDTRLLMWKSANAIWQEHLWLGAGPGQFDHLFAKHRHRQFQMRAVRVHNDYLNTLVDWGLIGFLIVAGAFVAFFIGSVQVWKHVRRDADDFGAKSSNRSAFALAAIVGTVCLLVHSFVEFNFHIPANAMLVFTLMAVVLSLGRSMEAARNFTTNVYGKVALTLISGLVMYWLAAESVVKYREGWRFTASNDKSLIASAEMQLLHEMHEIDPENADTCYRIGEGLRQLNWEKPPGWYPQILKAEEWFQKSLVLDPFSSRTHLSYGMCLDLRKDFDRATGVFRRAEKVDPNGSITMAYIGWHYLQIDDYKRARKYLERSLGLNWWDNEMAKEQLEIVEIFE